MNNPAPRALIAEDEPVLAQALTQALTRLWPALQVVASVTNGVAAVEQTLSLQPDVLFLDIRMPGRSGLEAAELLAEDWPDGQPFPLVVFVTAYAAHAVTARTSTPVLRNEVAASHACFSHRNCSSREQPMCASVRTTGRR